MPTSVKYIGTINPYFEVGVTGKQGVWRPGRSADVPDADAPLLIATGLFELTLLNLTPRAEDAAQRAYEADPDNAFKGTSGPSAASVAETLSYSAGLPVYDCGERILYRGQIPAVKVSNGEQFAYVPEPGFAIYPEILNNGMCSDATTALQPLAMFYVPGGTLVHNHRARLAARLTCADAANAAVGFGSTSAKFYVRLIGQGQDDTTASLYVSPSSTTASSVSIDTSINAFISNVLTFATGLTATTDSTTKRMNLLFDFRIEIGYIHAGSATGRFITLNETTSERARIEFFPATRLQNPAGSFRSPVNQPFQDNSIWNVPLPPTATYATNGSDAITDAVTGFGQPGSPVGNDYGGLTASSYAFILGYTDGAISVWQMRESDPWVEVTYGRRQYTGAPWPFPVTDGNFSNPGSLMMKLPRAQLPAGQTGDNISLLITPCKRYCVEVGRLTWNPVTGKHASTGAIAVIDLMGSGISTRNVNPLSSIDIDSGLPAFQECYRAAGVPVLGGLIRASDLAAGAIEHVVSMQMAFSQARASVFKVVTQSGNTFEIVPTRSEYTRLDYSSMFPSGTTVYHGGATYTLSADATWSAGTNRTTLTVSTTIATSNVILTLGGIAGSSGISNRQFVWPATTRDNASNSVSSNVLIPNAYQGVVPMGSFLAIPLSVDLGTLGLSTGGLILATAMQKYGAVITDTASNTFGICQVDQAARDGYFSLIQGMADDRQIIRSNLRRVTNYGRDLVRNGIRDKTASRPLPMRSIY